MKMVGQILELIFGLPSPERRKTFVAPWIERNLFLKGTLALKHDDLYIYFLMYKWSLIAGFGLLLLFGLSRFLELSFGPDFFLINALSSEPLSSVVARYAHRFGALNLCVLLPFYLLMFRYHFDLATYDLGSWHNDIKAIRTRIPEPGGMAIIAVVCTVVGFIFVQLRLGNLLSHIMKTYSLNNSLIASLFASAIIILIYPLFARIILMMCLTIWRAFTKTDVRKLP